MPKFQNAVRAVKAYTVKSVEAIAQGVVLLDAAKKSAQKK